MTRIRRQTGEGSRLLEAAALQLAQRDERIAELEGRHNNATMREIEQILKHLDHGARLTVLGYIYSLELGWSNASAACNGVASELREQMRAVRELLKDWREGDSAHHYNILRDIDAALPDTPQQP